MKLRGPLAFCLTAALLAVAGWAFMPGMGSAAQEKLSDVLIGRAWSQVLRGKEQARPWPWMDSHPVARLTVPSAKRAHVVMSGVSGAVLAYAPGWHEGTAFPGAPGISLISAPRDTHFRYLKTLRKGDALELQTARGGTRRYTVEDLRVVEAPEIQISESRRESILVLSTAYPFSNWQRNAALRFVVIARERKQGWASLQMGQAPKEPLHSTR